MPGPSIIGCVLKKTPTFDKLFEKDFPRLSFLIFPIKAGFPDNDAKPTVEFATEPPATSIPCFNEE